MEEKSIIYKTKSSIVIMPQAVQQLYGYTRYYIHETRRYLEEYQQALQAPTESSPAAQEAEVALRAAEQTVQELDTLQNDLQRIYTWNFERLAEVQRKARIEAGYLRIEDSRDLYLATIHLMDMLKAENPKFNREIFITAINRNPEEQPITNRAVRRLSTAQQ
jgi:hypothetical protein